MSRSLRARAGVLILTGLMSSGVALAPQPAYPREPAHGAHVDPDQPRKVFTISSGSITESSSLAVSTQDPSLVYTTNDSGDAATVYVLNSRSGRLVGRLSLSGVDAVDIEAIGAGSDGSLIVADIGDNDAEREDVALYRVRQPGSGPTEQAPERVSVTYAGGPRDAESVLYDARTGRVFVVSKDLSEAGIYRSPPNVFDRDTATLHRVADAPTAATDATWLPGTDLAVIRTYFGAIAYRHPGWQPVQSVVLPDQDQGESITAPPGADEVWVGSEGESSSVLAVPLPPLPDRGEPTPPDTTSSSDPGGPSNHSDRAGRDTAAEPPPAGSDAADPRAVTAQVVLLVAAAALVVVVVVGLWLYRRHDAD